MLKTKSKTPRKPVKTKVEKKEVALKSSIKSPSKSTKVRQGQVKAVRTKVVKTKPVKLTAEQQQARRSAGARKAALARWSVERPLSQKARKQQLARVPTSELTVEHYADRPNPELSWAAAILKRQASGQRQRQKAAEIMSRVGVPNSSGKLSAYWKSLTPEQRHELAQRAGRRRWEIWREERERLEGKSNSGLAN